MHLFNCLNECIVVAGRSAKPRFNSHVSRITFRGNTSLSVSKSVQAGDWSFWFLIIYEYSSLDLLPRSSLVFLISISGIAVTPAGLQRELLKDLLVLPLPPPIFTPRRPHQLMLSYWTEVFRFLFLLTKLRDRSRRARRDFLFCMDSCRWWCPLARLFRTEYAPDRESRKIP